MVSRPATRGYTCRSEGMTTNPFTVFEYREGANSYVFEYRRSEACKKGRAHGSAVVYVLTVQATPGVFVYTLSKLAVLNSNLAPMFETLNSRDCR